MKKAPKTPKKKSLLKKVGGLSTDKLMNLYNDGMMLMLEGDNSLSANFHDSNRYYNGLAKAQQYGRMLRQRGIKVDIPKK
tara:strand:- start:126 stop:365 length:240 start_codon:yes stop_codon:yes gene_type:complete